MVYFLRLLYLHEPCHLMFNGYNPQNEHTVVFFLPIIATFGVAHSIIERKLQLFYCYILLCMYVENRWFEEKWVLMHLHFARDSHSENQKIPKTIFSNVVANFNLSIYKINMILYLRASHTIGKLSWRKS